MLDRSDRVVNLCEMKFSHGPFSIDKAYAADLRRKQAAYAATAGSNRTLHLTFVTTEGIVRNEYSNLVLSEVTLDALFRA